MEHRQFSFFPSLSLSVSLVLLMRAVHTCDYADTEGERERRLLSISENDV